MDTKQRSALLPADRQVPTADDSSNWLVLSEWSEKSTNDKHMSNINLTELLDSAVAGSNPTEPRFQNVKSNICQQIPVSESDFDSDEILTYDGLPTDDEEIPLELEQSLLDEDPDVFCHEKSAIYSPSHFSVASYSPVSSAAVSPFPSPSSSNLDANNNLSFLNSTSNGSENGSFCLEAEEKPETEHRLSPKRIVFWEGQEVIGLQPSKKILNGSPYSTRINLNGHSNSIPNNTDLNSNILETNSKSSDDSGFFREGTVDGENDNRQVLSVSPHKSKVNSTHFSKNLCSELSEIYKDCNLNILDSDFNNPILSLEVSDVKGSLETPGDSVRRDPSDSQLELKSNLNRKSIWDRLSDLSSDVSSSSSQWDLMDQNLHSNQNKNSRLKSRNSACFDPAPDFDPKIECQRRSIVMPEPLIIKTTLDGDVIKVLNDETVTSPHQDDVRTAVQVSPGVKPEPTDEEKGLDGRRQFEINSELGKCSSQCEDSMIIRDLEDQSKTDNNTTISTPAETSLELSGDSLTTKPCSNGVEEHSTEQPLMKNEGTSLTNSTDIPEVNPGNLLKNSNSDLISLTCQDSALPILDNQFTDCLNKLIPKIHPSVKKPLKTNLEVAKQFQNSNCGAASTTYGKSSLTSNKSQQHSVKNCTKDLKKKEPEGSLESISESSSTKNLRSLNVKEESVMVISVKNNSNQKRIVKLGNQLKKDNNSSVSPGSRQVSLNEYNLLVTGKSKFGQESPKIAVQPCNVPQSVKKRKKSKSEKKQAKALVSLSKPGNLSAQTFLGTKNKYLTEEMLSRFQKKIAVQVSNVPQSVKECKKPKTKKKRGKSLIFFSENGNLSASTPGETVNTQIIPINCSTQTCSDTSSRNTPEPTSSSSWKCKKPKTKKKRGKTPISFSENGNLSASTPGETVNTQIIPINCSTQTCSDTSSRNTPEPTSSSSSLQGQTHPQDNIKITAENVKNVRKFVKAKRVLDKQKQLSTLLEGAGCLDECKINDRVQWVCRRWNVETLSNQDINLTTAAYIRRQLPTQEAACFQGCLEGQKDYTLAIVAPDRKRRLNEGDNDSTDAYDSLGHASKKRRLSQDVQLIPNTVQNLQPNMKLFSKQLVEKLTASQNMSMHALNRKRNEELKMLDQRYRYMQDQLQAKQFLEQQYYGSYGYQFGSVPMYQLQCEHNYQQQQFNMTMNKKYNDLIWNFTAEEGRLRTQYKTNVEKIKNVLSEDLSDSDCMTVALRKGPNRRNNYKTTYQTVNLSQHVALAMVREDEIYDSFYSHNV